jgi:hypothetical protein
MSLFDSASLVVTPNGVKEGKLYSIKPTDGSGDLVVTRATTATRVNSAGLVEVVPYNLLTYSEQFDNAAWGKVNATITANATTAPDGTLTADKFESVSSSPESQLFQTINSPSNTISLYAKAGNINILNIWIGSLVSFNLSTGVVTAGTATMENAGNGWWRCIIPTTYNVFNPFFNATASGQFVYVWGAQAVQGSSAKDYYPTTTRLNIPRLDYTNGSCPSILVEPQRTNLCLYSEQFDNAGWAKDNTSVTANTTISPSGISNADKVLEDTTNSIHRIREAGRLSSGTQTASCYFKAAERSFVFMGITDLTTGEVAATFNLSNGTGVNSSSGSWTNTSFTIDSVGNGWYRCTVTGTQVLGIGSRLDIYISNGSTISYAGTTGYGLFMWGAQIETGAYATSYIPTTSASVTRNADQIFKTGISSLIGQTEGTMFVDFIPTERINSRYISLESASGLGNGWIGIFSDAASPYKFRFYGDGFDFYSTNEIQLNQRYKIALSYKNGVVTSAYINGVSQGTLTASTTSKSYADFKIATAPIGNRGDGKYKQVTLWKTALTNTELATLTTI